MTISFLPQAIEGRYGHIIPLAPVDYTVLYNVMSQEVLLWLNAQYSTVAQYCSTVQTLFTQTQEENALIDTNQEAFS